MVNIIYRTIVLAENGLCTEVQSYDGFVDLRKLKRQYRKELSARTAWEQILNEKRPSVKIIGTRRKIALKINGVTHYD